MSGLARILLVLCAVFSAGSAFAAVPEFSAVVEAVSDGATTKSKVYVTGDRQRLEPYGSGTDGAVVMIIRLDKKVAWTIIPSLKVYMEAPVLRQEVNPLMRGDDVVCGERIGPDAIDGRPAVKEKATVENGGGDSCGLYYWRAADTGCPLRAEALDGSWSYTYKDIKPGRQAQSLFEVPEGYRKVSGLPKPDDAGDDTDGPEVL